MNKTSIAALIFLFGIPVVAGKVRAHNTGTEVATSSHNPSYMTGMTYKEAVEEGEITNCFNWEEQYTAFKIETPSTK